MSQLPDPTTEAKSLRDFLFLHPSVDIAIAPTAHHVYVPFPTTFPKSPQTSDAQIFCYAFYSIKNRQKLTFDFSTNSARLWGEEQLPVHPPVAEHQRRWQGEGNSSISTRQETNGRLTYFFKIMFALTQIKGVGRRYSNLVCKKADVDLSKRYVSNTVYASPNNLQCLESGVMMDLEETSFG